MPMVLPPTRHRCASSRDDADQRPRRRCTRSRREPLLKSIDDLAQQSKAEFLIADGKYFLGSPIVDNRGRARSVRLCDQSGKVRSADHKNPESGQRRPTPIHRKDWRRSGFNFVVHRRSHNAPWANGSTVDNIDGFSESGVSHPSVEHSLAPRPATPARARRPSGSHDGAAREIDSRCRPRCSAAARRGSEIASGRKAAENPAHRDRRGQAQMTAHP